MELKRVDPGELNSSRQTVFLCLVDSSGSMEDFEYAMQKALLRFKEKLLNAPEVDEIIVNMVPFTESIGSNEFTAPEEMSTKYSAYGGTALYDAICYGKGRLGSYLEELRMHGITAKGIMVVFSDGHDENSDARLGDARKAIEEMQSLEEGNIVGFVAFGDNARGIAEELNVRQENIWNTDATFENLYECFEVMSESVSTVSRRVDFTSKEESGILFYNV